MKKEKDSRKFYQMGGVDKKGGANFCNLKRGAGQKGGITIIKGGLVTPLETMVHVIDTRQCFTGHGVDSHSSSK